MATPASGGNFVQGLLSALGPWMTGANPSSLDNSFQQYGGTQGLLEAMMQGAGPDTSQAREGAAMQRARSLALQQAGARQQLAQGALGLQQSAAMFPILMGAMRQYAGQGSGDQSQQGVAPQGLPQPQSGASPAGGAAPQQTAAQGQPAQMPQQIAGPPQGSPSVQSGLGLARIMALMGRPGANTFLSSLTADPAYQTQSGIAKDPLTVDMAMVRQAAQQGDRPGAQAAYLKFLKDSGQVTVDRYGNVVTLGGLSPSQLGVSTFLPQQGVETTNGVMRLIPGAAGTLQSKSGAEARGEAQGQVEEVTDGNGNKYYVPRSALLGASGGGAAAGNGPAPGTGYTPFRAAVGPASEALLKDKGEQAAQVNEEFQNKAEAGQQMLAQIAELRSAANDFTPGQFADSRIKMLQWLQSSDLITKDEANRLGSAQAGQKIAIQLQAAATKQLGSREAAQIFQVMGKSLPNLALSPDGLSKVSGYMSGIARYDIARAQVAQHRMAENDVNGLNGVRDDFIQNTNPTYYIIASMPPAQQHEMVRSMGSKAKGFLEAWNKAANAGWAPRPNQYEAQ